jgi:roadblock/LC7 domain-containing protein
MGKVFITDEVNDSYVADVYADGQLKAGAQYIVVGIPSGTASGNIASTSGKYLLHSVIFANTGSGVFLVGDMTAGGASAISTQLSASAIKFFATGTPYSVIVDGIFNRGLVYRLSALDTDGIIVTYRAIA